MNLSSPPIGNAAVREFYMPVKLTEFSVTCGPHTFHVTANVKAAPNIQAFFALVNAAGLGSLVKTFDGCYNPRPKRTDPSELSMHAYGAAFDIDAATNEQGTDGDMPLSLVTIARSCGFFWGGDFRGNARDEMHFQLGIDFALDGRPEPRVTYDPSLPLPAPAPAVNPLRTVKSFDNATGALIGTAAESGVLLADGHAYVRANALAVLLGDPTLTAALDQGIIILRRGVKPPAA